MRSELKIRRRYLEAIRSAYRRYLRPPTIAEVAEQLGVTDKSLYYLKRLQRQGYLRRSQPRKARQAAILPDIKLRIMSSGAYIFWA